MERLQIVVPLVLIADPKQGKRVNMLQLSKRLVELPKPVLEELLHFMLTKCSVERRHGNEESAYYNDHAMLHDLTTKISSALVFLEEVR